MLFSKKSAELGFMPCATLHLILRASFVIRSNRCLILGTRKWIDIFLKPISSEYWFSYPINFVFLVLKQFKRKHLVLFSHSYLTSHIKVISNANSQHNTSQLEHSIYFGHKVLYYTSILLAFCFSSVYLPIFEHPVSLWHRWANGKWHTKKERNT